MKKKNGFTLIELLAVIIILGILMVIAVPAVSQHIDGTKRNSYVSIAKSLAGGARNMINSTKYDLTDPNTTYYLDAACINTENNFSSPYNDFEKAYVVVTFEHDHYDYYWTSVDKSGIGVKSLINIDNLSDSDIQSGLTASDITTDRGIDKREKIVTILGTSCVTSEPSTNIAHQINGKTGKEIMPTCMSATELHTDTCGRSDTYGCNSTYAYGSTITFGTMRSGAIKAGDAFDCDVNNDGNYDKDTERFYYIRSTGGNAVLLHSINLNNSLEVYYDTSIYNRRGPVKAVDILPSTSSWSNPNLVSPGTRMIKNELGQDVVSFSYSGKAARFLTFEDVVAATGISTSDIKSIGTLASFPFFFDNLGYYTTNNTGSSGYWMETPYSSDQRDALYIHPWGRMVSRYYVNHSIPARAVITVPLSEVR